PEAEPEVWTATPQEETTAPEIQRIALILWGHAAGLDHLYFYNKTDEPTDAVAKRSESLTVADPNLYVTNIQLEEIFKKYCTGVREKYSHKVDFKIDLLGFDSCLMAMSEICHEVAGSVSILVASDEVVPDSSWPYDTILSDLNKFPGMDASTL